MIISRTPLRMSFAGGGSDLRDYYRNGYGCVVSTAINKYLYINVNKRFTDNIRVGYSKIEYVDDVGKIEHNLVRESLKLLGISRGVEVTYLSDMLPAHEGSGLGASSSILVGTLNALHAYKGEHVSAKTLSEESCKIEIDILKHPIGKQDQYAAAYGGFNYIRFNPDESVFASPIVMKNGLKKELNNNLLLFYTHLTARSDTILTEQKSRIPETKQLIDKMVGLAENLKEALETGDLTEFGNILHKGWVLKKRLASNVSNDTIDHYYEKAINAGAVGGKILGSGGGGFMLFYCDPSKQHKVIEALHELKHVPFEFEPEGSKIIYISD